MFHPHVDTFLDVTVADLLVENDADGTCCYVVDDAGLAVVYLVWLFDDFSAYFRLSSVEYGFHWRD